MSDAVEVGRIVDGWGLRGWFKVVPYSSDAAVLRSCREWQVAPSERELRPAADFPTQLVIERVRAHGEGLVAQARGVADRAAADRLSGARIFVPRSSFPPLPDGEFYWTDLIGLDVVNRDGERLGEVAGLIETGPQTVLRVRPSDAENTRDDSGEERMIPFVDAYVDTVDLESRRIVVDWGLDY